MNIITNRVDKNTLTNYSNPLTENRSLEVIMKKRRPGLFVFVICSLAVLAFFGLWYLEYKTGSDAESSKPAEITETPQHEKSPDPEICATGERAIRYAEFLGFPVELCQKNDGLELRVVDTSNNSIFHENMLNALRHEVERLSTGDTIVLGSSGFLFQMTKGAPIWAPYSEMGNGNVTKCILFAKCVHWEGTLITAEGRTDPIREHEYYPYQLSSI